MSGPAGCAAAAASSFNGKNAVREAQPGHMGAILSASSSTQIQIARSGWQAAGTGVSVRTKPGLRCRSGFVAVLRYAGRLVNGAGDRLPPGNAPRLCRLTDGGTKQALAGTAPNTPPVLTVSPVRRSAF